jgi:hypothetical protein
VIRAELPGLDPDKDVEITIEDNTLVIAAERTREKVRQDPLRIPYGAFRRAMTLPTGGKVDDIKATYTDGILTVATASVGNRPRRPGRSLSPAADPGGCTRFDDPTGERRPSHDSRATRDQPAIRRRPGIVLGRLGVGSGHPVRTGRRPLSL